MLFNKMLMFSRPQVIYQLNPHLFIFIVQKSNVWNFYYFAITSWGNALFGETDLQEDHLDFALARGGLHWIYPTSNTALPESDLKLFRKFGCHWIAPNDINTWNHIPQGKPNFRDLVATYHETKGPKNAWDVIFRKKKYLISSIEAYSHLNCPQTNTLPVSLEKKPTIKVLKKIFEIS